MSNPVADRCICIFAGRVGFLRAWDLQKTLHRWVADGLLPNHLILLEHPHVYTLGRRGTEADILVSRSELERLGAEVHHIDRGGQATYHGPGQLVAYPIVDLRRWGWGPLEYVPQARRGSGRYPCRLRDSWSESPRAHGRVGARIEDRGHRRKDQPRSDDARPRPQRPYRQVVLRPHRTVRDARRRGRNHGVRAVGRHHRPGGSPGPGTPLRKRLRVAGGRRIASLQATGTVVPAQAGTQSSVLALWPYRVRGRLRLARRCGDRIASLKATGTVVPAQAGTQSSALALWPVSSTGLALPGVTM